MASQNASSDSSRAGEVAPLRLSLLKLAGPTILGNLLLSLVHLAAIKIVATLGDEAVAAVLAADRIYMAMQLIIFSITTGTTALVAYAWGARNPEEADRVRVLELGVLTDHLAGGHPTLGPDRVAAVLARVDEWLRQAPALSTTPPPPPRGASLRRRIGIGAGIAAAIVTGATLSASFLTDVSVARTESVRPTSTTAPPTTIGAPEKLLEVDISCPRLGLGYQLIPRTVSTGLDLLQVAATVDGQPQFIGSLAAGLPGPPIIGVPPSTTVGFDYVVVGTDESTGPPNHVDISTPPWPC